MKRQQFCGPQSGKLVFQLPEDVTFAYDLSLGRSKDCWKGLTEEYNRGTMTRNGIWLSLGPLQNQKNVV